MKKMAITWVQNDDEDFIRIETTNDGFNKFEIIGLLEDMKAKVVFDRGQEVSKILDKNVKKYKRLNKLQKEVQNAEGKKEEKAKFGSIMEELLNVKIKQAARPLTAMEAGIAIGEGCGHEAQSSKRLDDERHETDKEN